MEMAKTAIRLNWRETLFVANPKALDKESRLIRAQKSKTGRKLSILWDLKHKFLEGIFHSTCYCKLSIQVPRIPLDSCKDNPMFRSPNSTLLILIKKKKCFLLTCITFTAEPFFINSAMINAGKHIDNCPRRTTWIAFMCCRIVVFSLTAGQALISIWAKATSAISVAFLTEKKKKKKYFI